MATLDIKVPDIGDFADVAVIELMVKVGDTIKVDQSLLTVESDKASMEIPSSHAGVVTALLVKLGDKVKEGSPIVTLEVSGAVASEAATAPAAPSVAANNVSNQPVAGINIANTAINSITSSYTGAVDMDCDVLVLGGARDDRGRGRACGRRRGGGDPGGDDHAQRRSHPAGGW